MRANDVHGANLHNDTSATDLKFLHTCRERDRNFKSKSGTEKIKFAGAPLLPKFASEEPHGFANFGNGAPVSGCYKATVNESETITEGQRNPVGWAPDQRPGRVWFPKEFPVTSFIERS